MKWVRWDGCGDMWWDGRAWDVVGWVRLDKRDDMAWHGYDGGMGACDVLAGPCWTSSGR